MRLETLFKIGFYTFIANAFNVYKPINAMISVTNRCPSRCKYCDIPNRKQRELSTEDILKLIDQLAELGVCRIGLWGGEPLVRDDIGKIIDYANKKRIFTTLDSNGYLLKDNINKLKNLDLLLLSFDGDKKAHDANREKGSHDKVMEAIKIAKRKKKDIWTITVLTKNNLDQIDYIIDMAKKYKFNTTFQILHHSECVSKDTEKLLPSNEEYRKAIKKLIQLKKKGAPIVSSYAYLRELLKWNDYSKTSRYKRKGSKCFAGKLFFNVDTDGRFYPCVITIEDERIKSKNFLDVGSKKALKSINNPPCNECTASCLIEYNMMYSMNFSVIMNWIWYTVKKRI